MKKLIVLFLLSCFFVLCGEEYRFLVLGDIHYLKREYYPKLPKSEEVQRKRQAKYNMWDNGKSDALLAESARVAELNNVLFVLQLGDLCEGSAPNRKVMEQMLSDAFSKVKSYYPTTPITMVKGNHDSSFRKNKGKNNVPWKVAILPRMSKELGEEVKSVNYYRIVNQDLYIYYDGQTAAEEGVAYVKKVLEENRNARHVFFFCHLPIIPIAATKMAWRANGAKELIELLSARNAIVLTAHTHRQNYVSMTTPQGTITQLGVISIGAQWNPKKSITLQIDNVNDFLNNPRRTEFGKIPLSEIVAEMKGYKFNEFSIYSSGSGFVVVRVGDKKVEADYYTNLSGKPILTKTLR